MFTRCSVVIALAVGFFTSGTAWFCTGPRFAPTSVLPSAVARSAAGAEEVPGCRTTQETLQPGTGDAKVVKGCIVTVHATGVVKETGKKFWSTKDPGQEPFIYNAGVGEVIKGWDQGCLGMRVGEQRRLVIPAAEGYGPAGFPAWGIPPGGTLEFTLECLSING